MGRGRVSRLTLSFRVQRRISRYADQLLQPPEGGAEEGGLERDHRDRYPREQLHHPALRGERTEEPTVAKRRENPGRNAAGQIYATQAQHLKGEVTGLGPEDGNEAGEGCV